MKKRKIVVLVVAVFIIAVTFVFTSCDSTYVRHFERQWNKAADELGAIRETVRTTDYEVLNQDENFIPLLNDVCDLIEQLERVELIMVNITDEDYESWGGKAILTEEFERMKKYAWHMNDVMGIRGVIPRDL